MFGRRNKGNPVATGLQLLLAALRAQRQLYETLHWQAQGPNSYGDHILFERLYDDADDEIDGVAEKLVGIAGNHAVQLPHQAALQRRFVEAWTNGSPLERALRSEDVVLRQAQGVEQAAAGRPEGLGLQDLLGQLANRHLTNQYLLKQRAAQLAGRANQLKHPITIHSIGFPKEWSDAQIHDWLTTHQLPEPIAIKRGSSRSAKYAWARMQPVNRLLNNYRTGHWKSRSAGVLAVRWAIPRRRKDQRVPALPAAA